MNDDSTSVDIHPTSVVEPSIEASTSSNPSILVNQDEQQSDPQHCENPKSDEHAEDKHEDVTIPIDDSTNDILRVTIKLTLKEQETLTISLENVENVLDIRKYLTESFLLPLEHIALMKDGHFLDDETKLKDLGVRTMGVLELELQLKYDDDININRERIYEGCISTVDVINVPCKNHNGHSDIAVEIEYQNDNKEWLGGYKDRKNRKTFHNAISQTNIPSVIPNNTNNLRRRSAKQTQTNELCSNYSVKYGKNGELYAHATSAPNKHSIDYTRPMEIAINDEKVLTLAAAPKVFFGRDGRQILVETLDSQRAKTVAHLSDQFDNVRTNEENMKLIEDLKEFFTFQTDEQFRFKDDVLRLLSESVKLLSRGLKINSITKIRIKKYIHQYAVSLISNKENSSNTTQPQIITIADLSPYKAILSALRYDEISLFVCYSSVCHRMEIMDMVYLVDRIWNNSSVFGDCVDLKTLRMVRWNLNAEWSPCNCVLISKYQVKAHLKQILNYDTILKCQIRNKHLIAKVHFCEIISDIGDKGKGRKS